MKEELEKEKKEQEYKDEMNRAKDDWTLCYTGLREENQQLKKEIERLNNKIATCVFRENDEIVKLKSQLQDQRKKIEEWIKHFEFLGSTGDNYAKNVVKKLKD